MGLERGYGAAHVKLPSVFSLRRSPQRDTSPSAELRLPATPLSDGSITLRPWALGDAAARSRAMSDPEIHRWSDLPSDYDAHEAAQDIAGGFQLLKEGKRISLAIVERDEVLGGIDLMVVAPGRAEIGYVVAPWARRREIATRATVLLTTWAEAELDFRRLELPIPVENVASQGVARRAGYEAEGTLRAFLQLREEDDLYDVVMWARIVDR